MDDADPRVSDYERLSRLVHDPVTADGSGGGALDRLCRLGVAELDLMSAALTLPPSRDTHVVTASSGPAARRLEELQFDTGEGPTVDACAARHPVVVTDLAQTGTLSWPGFTTEARGAGVAAVFSFPLLVGAAMLGALTLYRATAGALPGPGIRLALTLSDLATDLLVDGALEQPAGSDGVGAALSHAVDGQAQVYQAQGMVMVRLGVGLAEALSMMRAHAYARGVSLAILSAEIVAGVTVLANDRDPP